MDFSTTICAIATGGGGALSVIRVSGKNAWDIAEQLTSFPSKNKIFSDLQPGTFHFASVIDKDKTIDEVIISLFRAPRSYTGEDMIEISCHASVYIQTKILELLVRHGGTLARPGEFTQRAFLNGKMDLSQAEAVADLIASGSSAAHKIAMDQMRGGFSNELKALRKQLLDFVSLIELELDFSEEDVEFADRNELANLVNKVLDVLQKLIRSFSLGNVIKNGIPVAIVGKPNVGKSTLLNRLLQEEKAIVSEIAGTTRDVIEDTMVIEGLSFRFIDTAGLRETSEPIETLGIRKTYQKIKQSEIILLLTDARDSELVITRSLEEIRHQAGDEKKIILLVNKTDLAEKGRILSLKKLLKPEQDQNILFLSAEKDEDLSPLLELLLKSVRLTGINDTDVIISNIRHYEALEHARENMERVAEGIASGITEDFLSQDIRQALHYLGEITGEITTDEVLGNIFRNFCIGK